MQLGEAFVSITGKDLGLSKALSAAERQTDGMVGRMNSKFAGIGSKLAAGIAMLGGGAFLKDAIEKAGKAEERQHFLRKSLEQTGDAAEANVQKLNDYAKGLANLTIYTKGSIVEGMALMHNIGVQTSQLEEASKAAIGLAAKYKIDLDTAFMLVGRAATGNTRMLARYGIVVAQTGTASEKFAQVLRNGVGAFNIAEAAAQTTEGKFTRLGNSISALATTLGTALLPYLTAFVNIAQLVADRVSGMGDTWVKLVVGVGLAVGAIALVVKIVNTMTTAWTMATEAVAACKAAMEDWSVVAKIAAAVTAVGLIMAGIKAATGATSSKITDDIKSQSDAYEKQAEAIARANKERATSKPADAPKVESAHKQAIEDSSKAEIGFAQAIVERIKARREQIAQDQEARRQEIGFQQASDIWRGGAIAGMRERYASSQSRRGLFEFNWQRGGGGSLDPSSIYAGWEYARAAKEMVALQKQTNTQLASALSYLRNLDPTYAGAYTP